MPLSWGVIWALYALISKPVLMNNHCKDSFLFSFSFSSFSFSFSFSFQSMSQIRLSTRREASKAPRKHCQVEVQEKYFWTYFQTIRKLSYNDFQYHKEVIHKSSNTFLEQQNLFSSCKVLYIDLWSLKLPDRCPFWLYFDGTFFFFFSNTRTILELIVCNLNLTKLIY